MLHANGLPLARPLAAVRALWSSVGASWVPQGTACSLRLHPPPGVRQPFQEAISHLCHGGNPTQALTKGRKAQKQRPRALAQDYHALYTAPSLPSILLQLWFDYLSKRLAILNLYIFHLVCLLKRFENAHWYKLSCEEHLYMLSWEALGQKMHYLQGAHFRRGAAFGVFRRHLCNDREADLVWDFRLESLLDVRSASMAELVLNSRLDFRVSGA